MISGQDALFLIQALGVLIYDNTCRVFMPNVHNTEPSKLAQIYLSKGFQVSKQERRCKAFSSTARVLDGCKIGQE